MHCLNQEDWVSNILSCGNAVHYACATSAGMCLPICCLLSRQWLPDPMIVLDLFSESCLLLCVNEVLRPASA